METRELKIQLQESDWAFVQSEIERLKREENADVTESAVISTLVETGIQREMEIRKASGAVAEPRQKTDMWSDEAKQGAD